jgi:hypothetical protein
MRGFLSPALRSTLSETQSAFQKLSRHRRASLAESASTTLVKASQWARGETVAADVATALDTSVKAHVAKHKG